jgi:hypothetical protein
MINQEAPDALAFHEVGEEPGSPSRMHLQGEHGEPKDMLSSRAGATIESWWTIPRGKEPNKQSRSGSCI